MATTKTRLPRVPKLAPAVLEQVAAEMPAAAGGRPTAVAMQVRAAAAVAEATAARAAPPQDPVALAQAAGLVPAAAHPVVVERRRYSNYNAAVANVPRPGTRRTPAKTFGYSGEWLVIAAPVRAEGRRWLAEIRYQFAAQWDSRIYPTT